MPSHNVGVLPKINNNFQNGPLHCKAILLKSKGDYEKISSFVETILNPILELNIISLECMDAIQALEAIFSPSPSPSSKINCLLTEKVINLFICNVFSWKFSLNLNPIKKEEYSTLIFRLLIRTFNVPLKFLVDLVRRLDDPTTSLDDIPLIKELISSFMDGLLDKKDHSLLCPDVLINEILLKSPLFDIYSLLGEELDSNGGGGGGEMISSQPLEIIIVEHFDLSIKLHHLISLCPLSSCTTRSNLLTLTLLRLQRSTFPEISLSGIAKNLLLSTDNHSFLLDFISSSIEEFECWSNLSSILVDILMNLRKTLSDKQDLHRLIICIKGILLELTNTRRENYIDDPLDIIREISHPLGLLLGDLHQIHGDHLFVDGFISALAVDFPLFSSKKKKTTLPAAAAVAVTVAVTDDTPQQQHNPLHSCLPILLGSIGCSSPETLLPLSLIGIKNQLSNIGNDTIKDDFLPPPQSSHSTSMLLNPSSITNLPNFISLFSKKDKKDLHPPSSPLSILHLSTTSAHQFLLQLSLIAPMTSDCFDDCLEIFSIVIKDLHTFIDPFLKEMIVRKKKDHQHHKSSTTAAKTTTTTLPQSHHLTYSLMQVLGCLGKLSLSLKENLFLLKKLNLFFLGLFIERSLFFLELGKHHKHAMEIVFDDYHYNCSDGGLGAQYSPLMELDLLVSMISSSSATSPSPSPSPSSFSQPSTATTPTTDEIQRFQEFWLLFSYIGFISSNSLNEGGRFRPSFSIHLTSISSGTPLLLKNVKVKGIDSDSDGQNNNVNNNSRNFSLILLEGEEVEEHLHLLRGQLSKMLGGSKEKNLSLPQCLWLISISLCESNRKVLDVAMISSYLTDPLLHRLGLAERVEILMSILITERECTLSVIKMLIGLLGHNNMRAHRCSVSIIQKIISLPIDDNIWDLLFEKMIILWMLGRRPLLSTNTNTTTSLNTTYVRELQGATEAFKDVRSISKDIWTKASRKSPLKFFKWASKTINNPSFDCGGGSGDRNIGCLEIFRIVLGDDLLTDINDLRLLQTMPFSNNEDYFMQSSNGNNHYISKVRSMIDKVEEGKSSILNLLKILSIKDASICRRESLGSLTLVYNYFIESLNSHNRIDDNLLIADFLLASTATTTATPSLKSIEYLTELLNHPNVINHPSKGRTRMMMMMMIDFLERRYYKYLEEYLRSIERFSFDKETFSLFQNSEIKCLDRILILMEKKLLFLLKETSSSSSSSSNKIPSYDKKVISGRRISLIYTFIHLFEREREDRIIFLRNEQESKHHKALVVVAPSETLLHDVSLISLDLGRILWERGNMKIGSFVKGAWRSSCLQLLSNASLVVFALQVAHESVNTIPEILFVLPFCPSLLDSMAISTLSRRTTTTTTNANNSVTFLDVAMKNLALRSLMLSGGKKASLIPQLIQTLRFSPQIGISLLRNLSKGDNHFAHQVIWNMKANQYIDDEAKREDPILSPIIAKLMREIISNFTKEELLFYEEEFAFFSHITLISSTIKPLLKKEKWEKKKKIDEELEKISLTFQGLYLPSNPECCVEAIKYGSGRPLQSHAKTPFMASFIVNDVCHKGGSMNSNITEKQRVQSVIFKVGDDCRQDVLALQLISLAKEILTKDGLNVYLFPYRVVATGSGQGVIEVIPNSISRDQLGREKINSLYDYFVFNFGDNPQSFHQARCNYVRSMAAYSVICYLFAIKDRHNGNIMLDDEGHVIHIDFGFILDIGPGGVFESAPFKLTSEMLQLMGGKGDDSQYFWWFRELCVQTFLLLRTHASEFINLLEPMISSGLPCFTKGNDPISNKTIKNMRARFRLDLDSTGARQYMYDLVYHSCENVRTTLYDKFQLSTNGIPY